MESSKEQKDREPYWFISPHKYYFSNQQSGSDANYHATSDKGAKILIVEDELLVAENLKCTLQNYGYTVSGVVSSGEEAIQLLSVMQPDIVLMDIYLKGQLNGVQTALFIQQLYAPVPIIFLSAFPKGGFTELQDIDPKQYAYINKPYSFDHLISAMSQLLSGSK